MKKLLIATTAIVAAGAASTASAAEWNTKVTGYYYLGVALSDADSQDGIGVMRDGEVHVTGRLVADNGLTFTARVELESVTAGDQIDENWASISGSFGTLMIGGNDDAVASNHVGVIYAPGAKIGYYDSFQLTAQGQGNAAGTGGFSNSPGVGADAIGLHYTSPSLSGFKVYGSYLVDASSDGANDTVFPNFSRGDYYAVGASYEGDFGDFGFGISGGYLDNVGNTGTIEEQISLGAYISASGFKVAGTYKNTDAPAGSDEDWNIGASYSTGPWSLGAGYGDSEVTDNEIAAGWVTYSLAPGVSFTAGLEYADADGVNGSDFGGLAYLSLFF